MLAKDHVLARASWGILQNCNVFRSSEFFATDDRYVATPKLDIKSGRITGCNYTQFHTEAMRDLQRYAHEYSVIVSYQFNVLGLSQDPVELWDTFKRETFEAAK